MLDIGIVRTRDQELTIGQQRVGRGRHSRHPTFSSGSRAPGHEERTNAVLFVEPEIDLPLVPPYRWLSTVRCPTRQSGDWKRWVAEDDAVGPTVRTASECVAAAGVLGAEAFGWTCARLGTCRDGEGQRGNDACDRASHRPQPPSGDLTGRGIYSRGPFPTTRPWTMASGDTAKADAGLGRYDVPRHLRRAAASDTALPARASSTRARRSPSGRPLTRCRS